LKVIVSPEEAGLWAHIKEVVFFFQMKCFEQRIPFLNLSELEWVQARILLIFILLALR
jgi:hypothetical protein